MIAPSPTDSNGRAPTGQFAPGNQLARGNPHARAVGKLRSALLEAVSEDDMRAIVQKLVEQAKAGDTVAAREVILRTLGKPVESDLLERMEEFETRLARTGGGEDDVSASTP